MTPARDTLVSRTRRGKENLSVSFFDPVFLWCQMGVIFLSFSGINEYQCDADRFGILSRDRFRSAFCWARHLGDGGIALGPVMVAGALAGGESNR